VSRHSSAICVPDEVLRRTWVFYTTFMIRRIRIEIKSSRMTTFVRADCARFCEAKVGLKPLWRLKTRGKISSWLLDAVLDVAYSGGNRSSGFGVEGCLISHSWPHDAQR
jgi:hypothetical protein